MKEIKLQTMSSCVYIDDSKDVITDQRVSLCSAAHNVLAHLEPCAHGLGTDEVEQQRAVAPSV